MAVWAVNSVSSSEWAGHASTGDVGLLGVGGRMSPGERGAVRVWGGG